MKTVRLVHENGKTYNAPKSSVKFWEKHGWRLEGEGARQVRAGSAPELRPSTKPAPKTAAAAPATKAPQAKGATATTAPKGTSK